MDKWLDDFMYIVLEGIDGAGKSTQIELLKENEEILVIIKFMRGGYYG